MVDPKRPALDTVDLGWEDETAASAEGADEPSASPRDGPPADPEAIERTIVDDHPGALGGPAARQEGLGETHVLPSDELDKLVDRTSAPDLGPTEALERADVERLLASDRAANARMPNRVDTPVGAPPRGGPAAPKADSDPPPPEPDFDLAFGGGDRTGELPAAPPVAAAAPPVSPAVGAPATPAAPPRPGPRVPSRPEIDAPSTFDNAPTATTAPRDVPFAVVAEDDDGGSAGGDLAALARLDGADTATDDATPLPAAGALGAPAVGLVASGANAPSGADRGTEPFGVPPTAGDLGFGALAGDRRAVASSEDRPAAVGSSEDGHAPAGSSDGRHAAGGSLGVDVPYALPAGYADETTTDGTLGRTGTTPVPRAPARIVAPAPPLVTAVVGGALTAVVVVMVIAWAVRGPKSTPGQPSALAATTATTAPADAASARSLMPPPASAVPRETGPVEEEARIALGRLRDGVGQCVRDTIGVLPGSSPAVPSLWSMVAKTGAYASTQRDWKKPVWACTHFTVSKPQRFQIQWQLLSKTDGQVVVWFDEDGDGKAERALRARATLAKKGSADFAEIEAVEPPAVVPAR